MRAYDLIRTGTCGLAVLLATCKIDKLTNHPPPIPGLSVAPGRVLDTAAVGSTAMQVDSIALSSTDAGGLSWSASVKSRGAWLDVTPKSGTTPARLHVQLNPVGLAPGVYQDTVVVSAGQAVGSPAHVPVDFVVAGSGPPPAPPSALAQFQSDGVTAVATGGEDGRPYLVSAEAQSEKPKRHIGHENLSASTKDDLACHRVLCRCLTDRA